MSLSHSKSVFTFLGIQVKVGFILGIFFWGIEATILLFQEKSISLAMSDGNLFQLILACIVYLIFWTILSVILTVISIAIQAKNLICDRTVSLSKLQSYLGGLVFWILTMIDIYYIWFPGIINKEILEKLILMSAASFCTLLPSIVVGFLINKTLTKTSLNILL